MNESLYGIFKAMVTEVDCFKTTGKIKTRISIFNNSYIGKDLLDNYSKDSYINKIERDKLTSVLMPLGGGVDCGLFSIPQINTMGLVTFLDGNPDNPVWLGAISSNIFSKSGELIKSNYPSDNIVSNKSIVDVNDESGKVEFMSESSSSFIIKTKTNELKDLNKPETMNWSNNKTENGIVLNQNRMELLHVGDNGDTQNILLNNDSEYSIKLKNKKNDENYSVISIGNNGIKVERMSSSGECTIYLGDTNNEIVFKKDGLETSISQTEQSIKLVNEKSSVSLLKVDLQDEVVIAAPKVRISSDKIILGNGDFRIVTSPSNFNLTLEDGTLLTTAKNVRI